MRRRQGQMKGKSKDKRTEGGRGGSSRESEQMEAGDDGEMRGLRKKKSRSDGEINRVDCWLYTSNCQLYQPTLEV